MFWPKCSTQATWIIIIIIYLFFDHDFYGYALTGLLLASVHFVLLSAAFRIFYQGFLSKKFLPERFNFRSDWCFEKIIFGIIGSRKLFENYFWLSFYWPKSHKWPQDLVMNSRSTFTIISHFKIWNTWPYFFRLVNSVVFDFVHNFSYVHNINADAFCVVQAPQSWKRFTQLGPLYVPCRYKKGKLQVFKNG